MLVPERKFSHTLHLIMQNTSGEFKGSDGEGGRRLWGSGAERSKLEI